MARAVRARWVVAGMVVVTMGYWFATHREKATAAARADANADATADATADADSRTRTTTTTTTTTTTSDGGTARIDGARREELRKRIFEGMWRNAEPEAVVPAGGFTAPPPKAQELSGAYVHARLNEDFRPMARGCYNEFLARAPDSGGGQLLVRFVIVGDEKVGGIVESAELDPKSTIQDAKLDTCIRESMLSMSFAPPEKGGSVTIVAPITFVSAPKDPK